MIELLMFFTFVIIVGGVFAIRAVVRSWQGPVVQQLAVDAAGRTGPIFGDLTDTLAAQLPTFSNDDTALVQDLRRAGFYKPSAPTEFLAIRNVLAISVVLLTGLATVLIGPDRPGLTAPILIWGLAISALVYALPWLYVRSEAKRRVARIQRSLPDAFDMLNMCLTGGMGLHEAIGHVSREIYNSHPDLAVELEIVRRHTEMNSLGEAFRQFARRIDAPEVVAIASIIEQTERLGTNVVQAVRDFADGVRLKLRQSADERASKAAIKLLFPIVLCLAPAALIVLWGPALLELRNFFLTFDVNN